MNTPRLDDAGGKADREDPAGGYCIIAGPTASGKSDLALRLAEACGGEIVNADSVQQQAGLELLTAAPGAAERARVPHHLYGVLGPDDDVSVAAWLKRAAAAIAAVQPRLAVVTGGSGLYLEALLDGMAPMPAIPGDVRSEVRAFAAGHGLEAARAALAREDPELAREGVPRDPQRVMRALEVLRASGRSIREWQRMPPWRPALPAWRGGLALMPARELLRERIERRLDAQLEAGLLDELAAWRASDRAYGPLAKADGVAEFAAYLDGRSDLETAKVATLIRIRRYAKRQRTWLRHRLPQLARIEAAGEAVSVREAWAAMRGSLVDRLPGSD